MNAELPNNQEKNISAEELQDKLISPESSEYGNILKLGEFVESNSSDIDEKLNSIFPDYLKKYGIDYSKTKDTLQNLA